MTISNQTISLLNEWNIFFLRQRDVTTSLRFWLPYNGYLLLIELILRFYYLPQVILVCIILVALKVCCGIWHKYMSSRSFRSCKLWDGASMDQIPQLLNWIEIWAMRRSSQCLELVLCCSNYSVLLQGVLSCWKRSLPSGEYSFHERAHMICNNA